MSIEDKQEYDGRYERVCANCGHEYGQHASKNDACPKVDMDGLRYGWKDETFKNLADEPDPL